MKAKSLTACLALVVLAALAIFFFHGSSNAALPAFAGQHTKEEARAPDEVRVAHSAERTLVPISQQEPSPNDSASSADNLGPALVTGRVIDSNYRPVPGVVVSLKCGELVTPSEPTNYLGEFSIESKLFGKDGIVIVEEETVPDGFLAPWRQEQPSIATKHPDFPMGFHAKEVRIPISGQQVSVDLRLFLSGAGWGQVITASGQPAPNVWVRLQSRIAGLNGLEMAGKSDQSGLFVIERLYPGKYRIEVDVAEADNPYCNMSTPIPTRLDIAEGASLQLPRVVIGAGTTTIRGQVVNQDGAPYPGLEVICYPKEESQGDEIPFNWNSSVARTFTDRSGYFSLPAIPPFTYGVFVGRNAFDMSNPVGTLPDGTKKLAFWKHEIEIDTQTRPNADLGTITAVESRPFVFRGTVEPRGNFDGKLEQLRVEVTLDENPAAELDPKVVPSAPKRIRVQEDGTFEWSCNTPHPPVRMLIRGRKRHGTASITVFPAAQVGEESRRISFPD